MERFGDVKQALLWNVLPGSDIIIPYEHCDIAVIDITHLDGLRYCFCVSNDSTESVSSYLAQAPRWAAEEQDAPRRQLVAHALANFELMRNIHTLPGACHFHTHLPSRSHTE